MSNTENVALFYFIYLFIYLFIFVFVLVEVLQPKTIQGHVEHGQLTYSLSS